MVLDVCKQSRVSRNKMTRVTVLEIGCGGRVPTVRSVSEALATSFRKHAEVTSPLEFKRSKPFLSHFLAILRLNSSLKCLKRLVKRRSVARINPEFPLPDRLHPLSMYSRYLCLPVKGLEGLRKISEHYDALAKPSQRPLKARFKEHLKRRALT